MKTATKKVGEVLKVKKSPFVLTVDIEGAVYTGKGTTALEALQSITKPVLISSGLVTITHAGKSKEMLYSGQQLKRLFNEYNQELLVNDLTFGMA